MRLNTASRIAPCLQRVCFAWLLCHARCSVPTVLAVLLVSACCARRGKAMCELVCACTRCAIPLHPAVRSLCSPGRVCESTEGCLTTQLSLTCLRVCPSVFLQTNNPRKISEMKALGLDITGRIPCLAGKALNEFNVVSGQRQVASWGLLATGVKACSADMASLKAITQAQWHSTMAHMQSQLMRLATWITAHCRVT